MKEKIKFLILGILIGAVITAGVFILLKANNSKSMRGMPPDFDSSSFPSDMQEKMNQRSGKSSSSSEESTNSTEEKTSSDESDTAE